MTKADLDKLVAGVHLDDGPANADEASYVVGGTKKEIGLESTWAATAWYAGCSPL